MMHQLISGVIAVHVLASLAHGQIEPIMPNPECQYAPIIPQSQRRFFVYVDGTGSARDVLQSLKFDQNMVVRASSIFPDRMNQEAQLSFGGAAYWDCISKVSKAFGRNFSREADGYSILSDMHSCNFDRTFALPEMLLKADLEALPQTGQHRVLVTVFDTPQCVGSLVSIADLTVHSGIVSTAVGDVKSTANPRYGGKRCAYGTLTKNAVDDAESITGSVRYLGIQSAISIKTDHKASFQIPDWGEIQVAEWQTGQSFIVDDQKWNYEDTGVSFVHVTFVPDPAHVCISGKWKESLRTNHYLEKNEWKNLDRDLAGKFYAHPYELPIASDDATPRPKYQTVTRVRDSHIDMVLYTTGQHIGDHRGNIYLAKYLPMSSEFLIAF